eukprot:XP_014005792.1 PREDICTED: proline-rich extensin-like protein EPR1 [Salmo salar]
MIEWPISPPVEPIVVELPTSPPVEPIVVELPTSPPVEPIVVELPISPPVEPIVVEPPISPPVEPIVVELPISPPVKPIIVELLISPPVKPIMVELPISPPVNPIVVELPIAPVEAESLQRFQFAPPPWKNIPLKGLTQQHRKRKKDVEISVPQARTTQPPPSLSDYFPTSTPKTCQMAQDFFPTPPADPIVAEHSISPPVKPIVVDLPISPPVEHIVVELPISPPVKPILVELPTSPPVKSIVVELPISPPVNHQDQLDQWANWRIEAGSSLIVDVPAYLPLPTSSDFPQQSPQEQPGVCTASHGLLANIGTLKEMIEIAWQKCQEYQSKFFMWCCVTLLCTRSRAQPIFPSVKPIVFERPISPPVELIVFELPISPPLKPIVVDRPISPPVKHITFELPIFPPVKPIVVELPISPLVKPILVELPISPPVEPIVVERPISPPVEPIVVERPISPPVEPIVVERPISPPVEPIVVERPVSPPVEPIVVELSISPPVKHVMFELPIAPVEAESLQRFEFAPPPRKNKPLKGLTQRHRKREKDVETSVPQARTTQPPPALSDFFPPVEPIVVELPIAPPVKPIVDEQPISPPVKHAMFELPICPVVAESLQRFEFVPPPQKNELLKGLTRQHKKRQKDTSVPKARTTLLPPCQFDFFPPPQGCQTAQNGVNPHSMRAGAPMGKYPGYPCTTTKAGPGISDAALAHKLRPLSPMCVPGDDGGWDSAGDHMFTPGTPFYMGSLFRWTFFKSFKLFCPKKGRSGAEHICF